MTADPATRSRTDALEDLLARRIAVLDGATGTMLRAPAPDAVVDALVLTDPQAVVGLHRAYLAAGADIVKTNTFNATRVIRDADGGEARVLAFSRAAAALARAAADEATRADPGQPRFVAGVLGPGGRSTAAYGAAARGLLAGGADVILIETVCDSRDAGAAIRAVQALAEELGHVIPVMMSATVDLQGRLLSGETLTDFWLAVADARPVSVGLNCAFGVQALRPHVQALADIAPVPISVHPNAGLPDPLGAHPDTPAMMAAELAALADEGLVNIVGGCCGTTPAHIAAIAAAVRNVRPPVHT